MPDKLDYASDLEEMERNAAIRDAIRNSGPHYTGRCWNCDEPLEIGSFCPGGECSEDYERRSRARV